MYRYLLLVGVVFLGACASKGSSVDYNSEASLDITLYPLRSDSFPDPIIIDNFQGFKDERIKFKV